MSTEAVGGCGGSGGGGASSSGFHWMMTTTMTMTIVVIALLRYDMLRDINLCVLVVLPILFCSWILEWILGILFLIVYC